MFPSAKLIDIIWLAFWLGWFAAALRSKKSINLKARPFIGMRIGIFVLLAIIIRVFNPNTYENRLASHNQAVLGLGFGLFLAGLALAIWARLYLGKNWGMPMTEKESPELVTSGPYQYVRHPIYSGVLLAAIGTAVAVSFYWLLIPLLVGIYFIRSALVEEKIMLQQFPKVYPAYKAKTKMLIPFVF